MENDICHICLENIDFLTINLIKDCCDAFICNPCWLRLKNNSDISECPICKEDIRTYCESSTQTITYSEEPRNGGRCIETKEKIMNDFPQEVEGLINCAALDFIPETGLSETGRFEDYPIETLDKTLNLNISAQILSCKLFGSIMAMNKKGSIINISSIYGLVSPNQKLYDHIDNSGSSYIKPISYSVSKSSLLNMTRYLATYWGKQGVRVNTLTLGGVYNGQDKKFVKNSLNTYRLNAMNINY